MAIVTLKKNIDDKNGTSIITCDELIDIKRRSAKIKRLGINLEEGLNLAEHLLSLPEIDELDEYKRLPEEDVFIKYKSPLEKARIDFLDGIFKPDGGWRIPFPATVNVYGRGSKFFWGGSPSTSDILDGLYVEHIEENKKGFLLFSRIANYTVLEKLVQSKK